MMSVGGACLGLQQLLQDKAGRWWWWSAVQGSGKVNEVQQ